MSGANVFIHESQFPDAVRRELIRSLRTRRINHKFHYESAKQAQKWLTVHEAHSPARTDRQCLAMYDAVFGSVAKDLRASHVHVVGLGCGGGQKDVRLVQQLACEGRRLSYTPCDVSVPLVLVARQRALRILDAESIRPLVCDLAVAKDIDGFLHAKRSERRLITFFGMIPNFEPRVILPKLAQCVRAGDALLFSANLVPGPDADVSMRRILSQYDNELTREWLFTLLFDLGVERDDGVLRFTVEKTGGLRRFILTFIFRRSRAVYVDSEVIQFRRGESVRLFFSYRHTPTTIARLLANESLHVLNSWVTNSGEEGVFLCSRR